MNHEARTQIRVGWALLGGALLLLGPLWAAGIPVSSLGIALTGAGLLIGGYRIRRTARAADTHRAATAASAGRDAAAQLYWRLLTSNPPPPPTTVAEPILHLGEQALLTLEATVSRWRRYAVTAHRGLPFWFADAFTAASVALNNLDAERHAHELARPAWREPHHSPVVLTSHRLLWREQSGWTALDPTLITAHRRRGHILDIEWLHHDPVRFHGPRVPELDVYLTWLLHGPHGLTAMPLP